MVALARLTFAGAPTAAPGRARATGGGHDTRRDDDLLPVRDRRRQVDQRQVGVAARAAGALERIRHPGALGQPHETGVADGADDVDDEPRGSRGAAHRPPLGEGDCLRRGGPCGARGGKALPYEPENEE